MEYNKVWDFFEEIYCINLDHRTDRWEHAEKEFDSVGLSNKVKRFSAIQHQDGRIGLIKSVLSIIKKTKEKNLDNVLIFQDDVTFINDPIPTLQLAVEQIDKKWSLFYLGATLHSKCEKYSPNLVYLKNAYAAHAIAYRKTVFDTIINKFEITNEIKSNADIDDVFICNEIQNKTLSFMTYPMIASQYGSYSDLEKAYVFYEFIEERFKRFTE